MNKHSRTCAGLIALAGSTYALALEKYVPSTDQVGDPAAGWDHMWSEVLIDISLMGGLFAIVLTYLIWKYRRQPGVAGGGAPKLSVGAAIGWAIVPAFIFIADDLFIAANGWQLWNLQRTVPADRLEVQLESGMYSWDYTYPNGVRTQNVLRVPAGKPVLLRMTSRDTIHSHYMPDFKIKEDSMPGRITYLWFYPKAPGKHLVTCNEYCGVSHSYMSGQVEVMAPEKYQAWYEAEGAKVKAASAPAAASPVAAPASGMATQNDKKPA